MTDSQTDLMAPAHPNLDPSILSAADVPAGWWLGMCWADLGMYESNVGGPAKAHAKALGLLAEEKARA